MKNYEWREWEEISDDKVWKVETEADSKKKSDRTSRNEWTNVENKTNLYDMKRNKRK